MASWVNDKCYNHSNCQCEKGKCMPEFKKPAHISNIYFGRCTPDCKFNFKPEYEFESNIQPDLKCYSKPTSYISGLGIYPTKYFCKCGICEDCKSQCYSTNIPDGRLIHGMRGKDPLKLDRKPFVGRDLYDPLTDIYDNPVMNNYRTGTYYDGYRNIKTGQIAYYCDKEIDDPYFKPNFILTNKVHSTIFVDPMGSVKPRFYREAITSKNKYAGCRQDVQDSLFQREDIMERQMRVMNQSNALSFCE